MYFNTETNLRQLNEHTLVVGIDIAKETHVARAMDYRGIGLGSALSFGSNLAGFKKLLYWINELESANGKDNVIVGMEPTGVYGDTLAKFLMCAGVNSVLVLGIQVKRAKSIEDNTPSKNDFKDARTIGLLVTNGHYRKHRIFSEEIMALKEGIRYANQLSKNVVRVKNQMHTMLSRYFPEFYNVFKVITNKTAKITLERFPLPNQLNLYCAEDIVKVWRKCGVIKGIGIKKAKQLKAAATASVGLVATKMTATHFEGLITEYNMYLSQELELWSMILKLLENNKDFKCIMSIPKMPVRSAAQLLAEVGDFRDFKHPRQVVRLAGLNLTENSSGNKRGLVSITKRGRPGLRRAIYIIMLNLLTDKSSPWWRWHRQFITRDLKPLKKMQSVIALSCKLLRMIWGMTNNGTPYQPERRIASKHVC